MDWIATLINGALLGGLYGLLGIGLALVFGVMRLINIAHGEFMVMGAFAAVIIAGMMPSVHPLLVLIPVIVLMFALGYGFQALMVNRVVRSPDPLAPLLLTFGVSVILRNLMVEIFGADVRSLQVRGLSRASVEVYGISIGLLPLLTLALAVVLFLLLQWVVSRTRLGQIIRATADNSEMVRLMGVKPARNLQPGDGPVAGVGRRRGSSAGDAFELHAVLGSGASDHCFRGDRTGRRRLVLGSAVGGIALGMAQLAGLKLDPNAGLLYAHVLFFIGLLLRPKGLIAARG